MNKKEIFGTLAVIFLLGILFTQQNSNQWQGFTFLGLVFGGFWYFGK